MKKRKLLLLSLLVIAIMGIVVFVTQRSSVSNSELELKNVLTTLNLPVGYTGEYTGDDSCYFNSCGPDPRPALKITYSNTNEGTAFKNVVEKLSSQGFTSIASETKRCYLGSDYNCGSFIPPSDESGCSKFRLEAQEKYLLLFCEQN